MAYLLTDFWPGATWTSTRKALRRCTLREVCPRDRPTTPLRSVRRYSHRRRVGVQGAIRIGSLSGYIAETAR